MSGSKRPIFDSDDITKFLIHGAKHPESDRSFLNQPHTDGERWSAETREWARERLLFSPPDVPLSVEIGEELEFDAYIRRKVYFMAAEHFKVSAYVLIPKGLREPAPAVVALHDHSDMFYYGKEKLVEQPEQNAFLHQFQKYRYGGRGIASELARRGYVVAVPDALGWGERGFHSVSWLMGDDYIYNLLTFEKGSPEYIKEYDRIARGNLVALVANILYVGHTFTGILVHNDSKTIDLLASMPEVDPNRIGCAGLSMGGLRAAWLTAMDTRVQCGCSVGFPSSLQDSIPLDTPPGGHDFWHIVPNLYNHLPYSDVAAMAMPRRLLSLYCENDTLWSFSTMLRSVDSTAAAYARAGLAERFESKGFPVGHQFDYDMQEYAFAWMDNILR